MIVSGIYIVFNILFISVLIYLILSKSIPFQKKKNNSKTTSVKYDIIVPCKDNQEKLNHLLRELLDSMPSEMNTIWVVDDGSKKPASVPKGVQLIKNLKSLGKTKALNKGIRASKQDWVICIDVDINDSSTTLENLPDLLGDFTHEIYALPFGEKFKGYLNVIQFEEAAIKLMTYFSASRTTPSLLSSAFIMIRKNLALESMKTFQNPYGWDMHLLKNYKNKIQYIYPSSKISAATDAKSHYKDYIVQRVRWIRNGLNHNFSVLALSGLFILILYTLDYVMLFELFFMEFQLTIPLISIYVLKVLSIYYLSKKWLKPLKIKLKALPFFVGQLFYGLNITIILIFLILQRSRTIRN